jgi:hypothetical protein
VSVPGAGSQQVRTPISANAYPGTGPPCDDEAHRPGGRPSRQASKLHTVPASILGPPLPTKSRLTPDDVPFEPIRLQQRLVAAERLDLGHGARERALASADVLTKVGNRVVLNDSSGTQITLMRSGDTLYAVMKDTATGRAATMSLAKEESSGTLLAGVSARLCQSAGGAYSRGICQPVIDQTAVAQQCEARGGVYFAADYCEVPAGGLPAEDLVERRPARAPRSTGRGCTEATMGRSEAE